MAGALQHKRLQDVKDKLIKPKRALRKKPTIEPDRVVSKGTPAKKSRPKAIARLSKELPRVVINKDRALLEPSTGAQTLSAESPISQFVAKSASRLVPNLEAQAAAASIIEPERDLTKRELSLQLLTEVMIEPAKVATPESRALIAELDPRLAAMLRPEPVFDQDDLTARPDTAPESDDPWLATLIENAEWGRVEMEKFTPTVPEMFVAHIHETMLLPDDVKEQTETFLLTLPKTMQERLLELVETGEQEPGTSGEELVISIAKAADRLHKLAMAERLNEPETDQIQQVLSEWYEQLSTTLGRELDEQATAEFIELVCSEDYKPTIETVEVAETNTADGPSAETFLQALPESVRAKLETWVDQKLPELTAPTKKLIVTIAETADQLHALMNPECSDEPTAEEITEQLRELYTELLRNIGATADAKNVAAFIDLVCSDRYQLAPTQTETDLFDNSLQERKGHHRIGLSAAAKILAYTEQTTHREIARLMVHHSAAMAA